MAATTAVLPQSEMPLAHESRGRVGMWCLIAAESAIFSIFVVAYLYYAGKSLSGPTPREVLHVPVFNSICLFASSYTIVMAERAIERGKSGLFGIWWLFTIALGADFHFRNGPRVVSPDLRRGADHQLEPFRDHVLLTRRFAWFPRHRRAHWPFDHHDLRRVRTSEAGTRVPNCSLRDVLALCRRGLGRRTYGCIFRCFVKWV